MSRRYPIGSGPSFTPIRYVEIVCAFRILRETQDYFTLSCLLGILQHVPPGFLSYPASHLVPYLRTSKYPPEKHQAMYRYPTPPHHACWLAKIKRAYKQASFANPVGREALSQVLAEKCNGAFLSTMVL